MEILKNLFSRLQGKSKPNVCVVVVPTDMLTSFDKSLDTLRLTEWMHPEAVALLRQHVQGVAACAYTFGVRDAQGKTNEEAKYLR